jgi:hypothetical protein
MAHIGEQDIGEQDIGEQDIAEGTTNLKLV